MIILKLNGGGTPQDGTKINYRGETYTRKGGGWVDSKGFAASNYLLEKLDSMKPKQYQMKSGQKGMVRKGLSINYKGETFRRTTGGWTDSKGRLVTGAEAEALNLANFNSRYSSGAKPKQLSASGNTAGERKPVASSGKKPAAASAPRSNFSTPTPTYFISLESGITGHGLNEDLKKYLESLGVKSVKELLERLNTDLKSGLVVDDKWGKRTQDAFTAGYDAWKNQQQERPQQQLFDYNQLFSQWNQWMNQQPRQQGITAMPATYDRYDIRHWLRENDIKGITAGGRKALRLAANGEAYDTRYKGIVDLYLPMLKGNLGSNSSSTPTMDPRYVEYFLNLTGTSYNAPKTSTTNVDDMYAPGYFHKVYDWMQNNPDAFLLAKLNMDFAKKAVEAYLLNNPLLPSISTPSYRSTDTHTNPMLSNKLFLKVSDWANLNLNLKDYSNNLALFAKEGGYIPKFQTAWGTITDMRNYIPSQNQTPNLPGSIALEKATTRQKNNENRRKAKVSGAKDMSKKSIMDLLDLLWLKGFFEGTGLTYDQAVDGIIGKRTRQAMEKAKNAGYSVAYGQGIKKASTKPSIKKKEETKTENNFPKNTIITVGGANIPAPVIERQTESITPYMEEAADFIGNNPALVLMEDIGNATPNRLIEAVSGYRPFKGRTTTALPSLQRLELENQVRFAHQLGKNYFNSDMFNQMYNYNYASRNGKEGSDRSGLWARMNSPVTRLEHTLGLYSFHTDKDGNVIVTDTYDFNDDQKLKGEGKYVNMRNNIAAVYGSRSSEPDKGKIHYKINLGKLW